MDTAFYDDTDLDVSYTPKAVGDSTGEGSRYQLPPQGNYQIRIENFGPAAFPDGRARLVFGAPGFTIRKISIAGPEAFAGDREYGVYQDFGLRFFDRKTKEGKSYKHNDLVNLVRGYDVLQGFANVSEGMQLVEEHVAAGDILTVRLDWFAEDYKGRKAAYDAEGLSNWSMLSDEQKERRKQLETEYRVQNMRAFPENPAGGYLDKWTSPAGNTVNGYLRIRSFYPSSAEDVVLGPF